MRREGELAAQASLGYVATQGLCLVTIIIDAGFVNRVARLFLLLNQFWPARFAQCGYAVQRRRFAAI